MASPANPLDRLQSMRDWAGLTVQGYVYSRFDFDAQILDVGAGWGKYRDLLPDYENIDAVEIWDPYIHAERLRDRYRQVYSMDVADMHPELLGSYDLVIFGDVLEHLPQRAARNVLRLVFHAVVIVPFEYPQGPEQNNPYEEHIQDDLTPDVMAERYPALRLEGMELQDGRPFKGFYVKDNAWEQPATDAPPT